jgi:hypothetical protein
MAARKTPEPSKSRQCEPLLDWIEATPAAKHDAMIDAARDVSTVYALSDIFAEHGLALVTAAESDVLHAVALATDDELRLALADGPAWAKTVARHELEIRAVKP